jgi:hypothetical protein
LAGARDKFLSVKKSAENKFAGFRYPTFTDMTKATLSALHANGLVLKFASGFIAHPAYTGEVMVGRLVHHKSKQWEATTIPKRYPIHKGVVQQDGQGLEIADTYAKKTLIMELTGAWLEGDEPEVEQDQGRKAAESMIEAVAEAPKPEAPSSDFYRRLETKMRMVKSVPAELEKCFVQAESLAQTGDLTADQLSKLTRQFGALRKKEVANAQ